MSRVVFLLGNLTDGGSETKTVRMANRLVQLGHDVHIVYIGEPHTLRSAIDAAVPVEFLERRGRFSVRAYKNLKAYVLKHDIDTVFCINQYPLVYGWPVCRFAGRRRRCVGAMNTYEITSLRDRVFMQLYAFMLRRCDRIVFGSKAQQQLWIEKYRLQADSSVVIYNGVDADHFQEQSEPDTDVRDDLKIDSDAVVIGCVGHLRPEKSQQDLLEAMKSIASTSERKVLLLLVGDGPEEDRLRHYTETNDLTNVVRFCGRASDVRPYLKAMDIFVMPSSSEVFSNAILEAMSMRLPVVCTAVGGSVEMVVDGKTGLTYPRHQIDKLVAALGSLISDEERRRQFGNNGAERVQEVFSIAAMDEQYLATITAVSRTTGRD